MKKRKEMIRVWRLDKLADSSNMSVIEGAKELRMILWNLELALIELERIV